MSAVWWLLAAAVVMTVVVVAAWCEQVAHDRQNESKPCGCPRAPKRPLSYIPPQNGRNSR